MTDLSPARAGWVRARILVVDDTPANLIAVRAVLEPLDLEIVTADSGEMALQLAAESDFTLVLLDVMMPVMDGLDTLKRLRCLPSLADTPVLLLSAYEAGPLAMEGAYAMGAADYIFKPIAPAILRAKVDVFVSLYRRGIELRQRGEALAAKDRQIAILAHDLRSPLATIDVSAETLCRNGTAPRDRTIGERIRRTARRMDVMVRDLLDYARVGAAGLPVSPTDVDLGDLCREVVGEVSAGPPERPIAVETEGELRGRWDPGRVHQALSNLLVNAIKYGNGKVGVRARHAPTRVEVAVWNDGDPIPAERLARLFEPFEPGLNGGTGLGLYIVREIARSHGGAISVQSSRENGTVFTMSLPLQQVPA